MSGDFEPTNKKETAAEGQIRRLTADRDAALARVKELEQTLDDVYYRGCQEAYGGTDPECPYQARIARLEEALRGLMEMVGDENSAPWKAARAVLEKK